MKTTLLITDVDFWERGAGHRMRILHLLQYLVQHVHVTIAYVGALTGRPEELLRHQLAGNYVFLSLSPSADAAKTGKDLRRLLGKRHFDSIIVEYIHNTLFLKYLDITNSTLLLDAHDIISDRTVEFEKFNYGNTQFAMSPELEFQVFDIYDHVLVLCLPDYEKVNRKMGDPKAMLCPHPVAVRSHAPREKVRNLTFVASEYPPNVDAMHFFIRECWPALHSAYDIELWIYGNVCKMLQPSLGAGVVLKGYAADLATVYSQADIVINPVRFGAGLKIKNIEALANGMPLVTTGHGARGLEPAKGTALLVAEGPAGFIESLARLVDNAELRISLGRNAITYVKEHFSAEACFGPLLEIIA
ncbi:MAG TPA: glycosyltransferase family 4 protein [Puia sp.]|nr:glycosyltransferase family 4 protein [Puia sp.]